MDDRSTFSFQWLVERPPNRTRQEPLLQSQIGQPHTKKTIQERATKSVTDRYSTKIKRHSETIMELREKSQKTKETGRRGRSANGNEGRKTPRPRGSAMELSQWLSPACEASGGQLTDPPGQGTP